MVGAENSTSLWLHDERGVYLALNCVGSSPQTEDIELLWVDKWLVLEGH